MTPSIVIVPGSFTLPSFYDELKQPLTAKGHDVHVVPLLSAIGKAFESPAHLPTMYDDAAAVAKVVEELADLGKDVVVIAHSYGGKPATESVKGLSKDARRLDGKQGGVVRLAYMTATAPEVGSAGNPPSVALDETPEADSEDGDALVPVPDERGWLSVPDIDALIRFSFAEVQPEELARKWADRITRHSSAAFASPLTYAGYKDVPSSWLLTALDKLVTPATQQAAIDGIEKATGNKVDVTTVQAGHIPYIMALDEVVAWVEKVVSMSS